MRDASKARGVEHTGVFERRATPLAAMQRRPNALVILRRALSKAKATQLNLDCLQLFTQLYYLTPHPLFLGPRQVTQPFQIIEQAMLPQPLERFDDGRLTATGPLAGASGGLTQLFDTEPLFADLAQKHSLLGRTHIRQVQEMSGAHVAQRRTEVKPTAGFVRLHAARQGGETVPPQDVLLDSA